MQIVSWNMQNLRASWRFLVDQHQDFDVACVQEACTPTDYVRAQAAHWDIPYERWQVRPKRYKQEILRISAVGKFDRLDRDVITAYAPNGGKLLAPRMRAAAVLRSAGAPDLCLVSTIAGPKSSRRLADTISAVRRTLQRARFDPNMPIIAAGDLTTDPDRTPETFAAMAAIGMQRIGPDAPNYIQKSLGERPATAWRTLNHVFASTDLADRVSVTALNDPDERSPAGWGPSDHCRIKIEVR